MQHQKAYALIEAGYRTVAIVVNKEIRRNNLRELMVRYTQQGINQNEFAAMVESSCNLCDNLAKQIEAKLNLPKGWFNVFNEKSLAFPLDNVASESYFQPARLKPIEWEDSTQDKEEFVEISLLDIDFSAGDGCYEIIEREEFSLIFSPLLSRQNWGGGERSTDYPHFRF